MKNFNDEEHNSQLTDEVLPEPEDARVIANILKAVGVESFDTRVVAQLVEFVYKYIGEVLELSKTFAQYAEREDIRQDDVKLAISSLLSKSFTQPPSRDVLLQLCRERNAVPLPVVDTYVGIQLPPKEFQLTTRNYQLKRKTTTESVASQELSEATGNISIGESSLQPNEEESNTMNT
ncbi:Transcription initiation factor TFIID subunit 9 [Galdieria sulphuraria]|nr:Transcription initiation factor TFIID subunit 9 [Galdieria sulphuraria]